MPSFSTRSPLLRQLWSFATASVLRNTDTFTTTTAQPLPYFVHRSSTGYLPVYQSTKVGGTKRETKIRKLEGNVAVLREHLIESLKLDPEWIYVNNLTKQIIIKGHLKPEVTKFLTELKF